MNTEQRLRDALQARAATAAPNPDAFAQVRRRARRRRHAGIMRTGAVAAAVVTMAVGVAFALDGGERTSPPVATESPSPSAASTPPPSPAPSETASPTASPSPTPGAIALPRGARTVGRDEYLAVLDDGRLAAVSATSGDIAWFVPATVTTADQVVLTPDRTTAFLVHYGKAGQCGGQIDQVDLGIGRRVGIGTGANVDVSPDGTRIAYVSGCGNEALTIRELATGTERHFVHREMDPEPDGSPTAPWSLDRAVWQADGKRLWVVVGWENSTELRVLDPATDRTTSDARAVRTKYLTFDLERRGGDLVYRHSCCYADETGDDLIVARAADGTERVVARVPHGERHALAAGPDGDVLFVREGRLYRLDVATGATRDLGASTAISRDW